MDLSIRARSCQALTFVVRAAHRQAIDLSNRMGLVLCECSRSQVFGLISKVIHSHHAHIRARQAILVPHSHCGEKVLGPRQPFRGFASILWIIGWRSHQELDSWRLLEFAMAQSEQVY